MDGVLRRQQMAFKKKEVKQELNEIPYKGFKILIEPHELGARVILLSSFGTVVTQEYGERETCIELVKSYVK